MKKLMFISLLSLLILFGCQSREHEGADHEEEMIAVTQWTDKMEIFMEYETAVVGHEIKFIIHLTTLSDFQPVRDGKVTLNFKQTNGQDIIVEKDELLREGIFTPTKIFKEPGDYEFSLSYQGTKAIETFSIGKFNVYPLNEAIPEHHEESQTEEITFLKEQQWKIDFATEEASIRPVKSSVQAVGEIRPRPASYAEIVTPVQGIISIASADQLVKPGQKVVKGQTLAVLVPPLATQNSWAEIYLDYEKDKAEYDRAKRLKERNAISDREYEQARRDYEIHKAGFSNYFDSNESSIRFDSKNQQFIVTAPINGTVSDVSVLPGQKVDQNQKLFSIVNPNIVWLRLDLFAKEAAQLKDISGISIRVPGNDTPVHLDQDKLILISRGKIIDPKKRTVTVWVEADNRQQHFLIGQPFNARVYTGAEQAMLTIPQSAVFNDNAQKIIFVHISGESFEKRVIKAGSAYNEYITVLSGIEPGERIVSQAGYQVKLASTSEEIGHAHTH